MARNKYPEQTVEKILNISYRLFMEKGYENTTIQDITNELGMSKGAIYHHYKSKADILDALGDMQYYQRDSFTRVMKDDRLNGLQKLKQAFILELGNLEKQELDKMMKYVDNPRLLAVMVSDIFTKSAPIFMAVVDEGVADGSITVSDSRCASEVIMLLINVWMNPMMAPETMEGILNKLDYLRELTDKMGIPILDDEVYEVAVNYFKNILDADV